MRSDRKVQREGENAQRRDNALVCYLVKRWLSDLKKGALPL